jgi:alpha-amylase
VAFRFSNTAWSEFPLTAEKFAGWLNRFDKKEETVNLFIDYETFGEHQWMESGIFEFLKALPGQVAKSTNFVFSTPSEIARTLLPISTISVPYPISWADEERDLTAWLGNEMQVDAFNRLYSFIDKVNRCDDPKIMKDWKYLQASDHLYYMATKFFTDGAYHAYYNPYESPYEAYINYMNVLSDFGNRLFKLLPETSKDHEIADLSVALSEKEELLKKYDAELKKIKSAISKLPFAEKPAKSTKTKGKTATKKMKISSAAGKK